MEQRPTIAVSVIVPIFNTEDYLEQCLTSIANQNLDGLEILCLNDGSTDGSLEIMQKFAANDTRFRIIDKPNEGYGTTVNRGIDLAQGEYIAIVEPDDYLCGPLHEKLYALAQSCNNPDIVKSAYWTVAEADNGSKTRCGFWGRVKPSSEPFRIAQAPLLMRYHPSIWSALYRKAFLNAATIRFREVPGAGWVDNPFMVETYLKANSIIFTNDAYYCYREDRAGSSSVSIGDYRIPVDRWIEMDDIIKAEGLLDEQLLGIHAYRGFYCLSAARSAQNFNQADWSAAAQEVLLRMDPSIVARSPFISQSNKALYTELAKRELSQATRLPYYRMLAREAYWKIRQNGIHFFLQRASQRRR
ncbi:MAG: glycosyltransferase [Raoultibacter sp.]